jgi:hypothetical protein
VEPGDRPHSQQCAGDAVSRFFSLRLFTLVASLGYAYAVYANSTLFRYYPLVKRFSLTDLADKSLGPAMTWYGWMALGVLPAIVVAVIGKLAVPPRLLDKLWPLFWVVPFVILAAGWVREKSWILAG